MDASNAAALQRFEEFSACAKVSESLGEDKEGAYVYYLSGRS